jgi:hypothetical protein
VTSKKQGTSALALQPKDAVPGEETVWVPQDFINETEFKSIYFGACYKAPGFGGRHLIKPSELALVNYQSITFNSPLTMVLKCYHNIPVNGQ